MIKYKSYIFLLLLLTSCNAKNDKTNDAMKTEKEWRDQLSPEQFRVTRHKGTERPFTGIYNDFYEKGKYECVCCGEVLFDSESKFSSGCGWPSYSDMFNRESITLHKDTTHGMIRTEVLCSKCDAHLGHVFNDGPPPTGLRYCINSASLNFVPDSVSKK